MPTDFSQPDQHARRRQLYEKKRIAIARGEDVKFYAPEFVQYILDRQKISLTEFDLMLGRARDYFRSDVFNTDYNNESRSLPAPLRAAMIVLTGKDDKDFWRRTSFSAAEADDIRIDPSKAVNSHAIRLQGAAPHEHKR